MSGRQTFAFRIWKLSRRIDRRVPAVIGLILLLSLAVATINIGVGQFPIAPVDVLRSLLGVGVPEHDFVVNSLRLPRALVAFLVGTGFALSGGILQGMTRNPLASPDVVGVIAGANLAAGATIVWFPDLPWSALPPVAFAGALLAAAATYLLAQQRGSLRPMRLILVGIGVAAVAQALVSLVIASSRQIHQVSEVMLWIAGTVYGRTWSHLEPLALWLAVLVPLALMTTRHLNVLQLGEEVARGLGGRVELLRALLMLTAVGLAGVSVATAGSIGFVGLMAPHMARRLVGSAQGALLPVAGLLGGLIVLTADLLGRTLFAPIEIPAGVITAAVGAPYFIYLLLSNRQAQ